MHKGFEAQKYRVQGAHALCWCTCPDRADAQTHVHGHTYPMRVLIPRALLHVVPVLNKHAHHCDHELVHFLGMVYLYPTSHEMTRERHALNSLLN